MQVISINLGSTSEQATLTKHVIVLLRCLIIEKVIDTFIEGTVHQKE